MVTTSATGRKKPRLDLAKVRTLIDLAVEEDFGQGDPTSRIVTGENEIIAAKLVTREEIVVCGMDVVREILKRYDKRLKLRVLIDDGRQANVTDTLGVISSPLRGMLSA